MQRVTYQHDHEYTHTLKLKPETACVCYYNCKYSGTDKLP